MKPASFNYHAPHTVEEARELLSELGDEAKVLAGGQSLVPMLNMRLTRFEVLIDLNRIAELKTVSVNGDGVRLGGMVRQREIEESEEIAASAPLLAKATPLIGHFQIRNRGTVGGSIAHADPAAEYPAVALALDAEMELTSAEGSRQVAAADFFTGTWETVTRANEVLTTVTFPPWGKAGFAVEEVGRRHGDFAMAGACVGIRLNGGGRIDKAAISLFGVAGTPVRATAAESGLIGQTAAEVDPEAIGQTVAADLDPPEDLHATAGLRRRMASTMVRRAVQTALQEAGQ